MPSDNEITHNIIEISVENTNDAINIENIELKDNQFTLKHEESRKRHRSNSNTSDNTPDSPEPTFKKERKPNEPSCSTATTDTCHLKPEYLKHFDITPPLTQWVRISNFRCDKSELREVLELAGHVVSCSINHGRDKYAKVMYSHPLEAVQAITMLNKQKLYGMNLKITMIKCPYDTVMIPKGLSNIGPGFGAFGKPLRDIVKEYDKFVNRKPSLINKSLFQSVDTNTKQNDNETQQSYYKKEETNINQDLKQGDNKSEGTIVSMDLDNMLNTKSFIIKNIDEVDNTDTDNEYDACEQENVDNSNKNSDNIDIVNINKELLNKNQNQSEDVDVSNEKKLNVSQGPSYKSPIINAFNNSLPPISIQPVGYRASEPQSVQVSSFSAPRLQVPAVQSLEPMCGARANTPLIGPTGSMGGPMSISNRPVSGLNWSTGNAYEKSMNVPAGHNISPTGFHTGPTGMMLSGSMALGSNRSSVGHNSTTILNPPMSDPCHSWSGPSGFMSGFSSPISGPNNSMSGLVNRPMSGSISTGPRSGFSSPVSGPNHSLSGPIYRPMTGASGVGHPSSFNSPMSGPHNSMSGPVHRMSGPIVNPNCTTPTSGLQGGIPGPTMAISNSSTIEFRNLPLSTTFTLLSNKLSQCGPVMSLQFTTPGCAVVRFSHPSQAEKCFERFNGTCVEGCVIEARFI